MRSAAGRAALESVMFAPAAVLPGRRVRRRAASDDELVATFELPPERPEVRVHIDDSGAIRSISAWRWGPASDGTSGYQPCVGEVLAERRFGAFVLPSEITVAWGFGTPHQAPFFHARMQQRRPEHVTPGSDEWRWRSVPFGAG